MNELIEKLKQIRNNADTVFQDEIEQISKLLDVKQGGSRHLRKNKKDVIRDIRDAIDEIIEHVENHDYIEKGENYSDYYYEGRFITVWLTIEDDTIVNLYLSSSLVRKKITEKLLIKNPNMRPLMERYLGI